MAVYGLNEIAISEDTQERIDIGKLYHNVMAEDYTIFSEDCILLEAFDFNKIKSVVKEKFTKLIETVKKVLKSLLDSVKDAIQKIKDAFDDKKYEILCNSMDRIFENKTSVTITAPEIIYDYSSIGDNVLFDAVDKLNSAVSNALRSKPISHVDFVDDNESITDKINDIHNQLKDIQDKYEDELKESENIDIDALFFRDKNPKDIKITKKNAIDACNSLYLKNMDPKAKGVSTFYNMGIKTIDDIYKSTMKTFESLQKHIYAPNATEEEQNSYAAKFTNEYASFLSNLQKKCYSVTTSIYTRYTSAYKSYIKTLSSILRKILIVGHININSDNSFQKDITDNLDESIKDNDIKYIRSQLTTLAYTARGNPKKLIEKYIKYVQNKGVNPMEDFDDGDPLISKTKSTFEDDDFADAVYNLRTNFSKERLDDLDIIGNALYGAKRITRWN